MAHEREPLLQQSSGGNAAGAKESSSARAAPLPWFAGTVLKFLMWAVFLTWAAGIFLYPTKPVQAVFKKLIGLTTDSMFGIAGGGFLSFSAPILIIALLAYLYISFFPSDHMEKRKLRSLSFRLWTFPVLVDGPFGVVSAVEFIGIVLFIVYVVYSMAYYSMESVSLVAKTDVPSKTDRFVR